MILCAKNTSKRITKYLILLPSPNGYQSFETVHNGNVFIRSFVVTELCLNSSEGVEEFVEYTLNVGKLGLTFKLDFGRYFGYYCRGSPSKVTSVKLGKKIRTMLKELIEFLFICQLVLYSLCVNKVGK